MALTRLGTGPSARAKAAAAGAPNVQTPTKAPAPVVPGLTQPSYIKDPKIRGKQTSFGIVIRDLFDRVIYKSDAMMKFKNSKAKTSVFGLMKKFFKPSSAAAFRDAMTKWSIAEAGEGSLFSLNYDYELRDSYYQKGDYGSSRKFKDEGLIPAYKAYLADLAPKIDWDDDTGVVVGGCFIFIPLVLFILRANYVIFAKLQSGGLQSNHKNHIDRAKMNQLFDAVSKMIGSWKSGSLTPVQQRKFFQYIVYYLTVHKVSG